MITITDKSELIVLQHIMIDARDSYRRQRSREARYLVLILSRWIDELDA